MLDTSLTWEQLSFGYVFGCVYESRYIQGTEVNLCPTSVPIWDFIFNHFSTYKTFPTFTHIKEKFNMDYQYYLLNGYKLEELGDRLRLERYKSVAELVQVNIQKVLTRKEFNEADILTALGSYRDHLQDAVSHNITLVSNYAQIMADYRATGGDVVCQYGFPSLDKYTSGISKGDYIVIYGNTRQGKSTFARKIAMNIAEQGKKVLYFTLEESSNKSVLKTIGTHVLANFKDLMYGTYSPKTYQQLQNLQIPGDIAFVDRLQNGSIAEISQYIFQMNPDVVVIDQLPHLVRKGQKLWEEMQFISSQLRQFFQVQRIPAIVLSQANRLGTKKNVTVEESIAMSYAIIQDASVGIFVHPFGDNPNRKPIQLVKNRDGESDQIIELLWELNRGLIKEETVIHQPGNIDYATAKPTLSMPLQINT